MNPFEAYGQRATSVATPRLVGVMKTRAEAKQRYGEITTQLASLTSISRFHEYVATIDAEIIQFRSELPFLWEGHGDFAGLQHEIELAECRLDDRLDYPRYDVNTDKDLDQ